MAATKKEEKLKGTERLLVNFSLGGVVNLPVYRDDLAKLLQWKNISTAMLALALVCIAAVIIQSSKIAANEQCKSEYCGILNTNVVMYRLTSTEFLRTGIHSESMQGRE